MVLLIYIIFTILMELEVQFSPTTHNLNLGASQPPHRSAATGPNRATHENFGLRLATPKGQTQPIEYRTWRQTLVGAAYPAGALDKKADMGDSKLLCDTTSRAMPSLSQHSLALSMLQRQNHLILAPGCTKNEALISFQKPARAYLPVPQAIIFFS